GRGGVERAHAEELGLDARYLVLRYPIHIADAIRVRLVADGAELGELAFGGGDDQLAAAPVRHAGRRAVIGELVVPRDAGARLERAFRVVDAGVDHLAVPR